MPTSRAQIHVPNGHDKRNAILPVAAAFEAVRSAGAIAQTKIASAAGTTGQVVKAHPLKSVGVALGGGLLLGALAAKALAHKPTLGEAFHERLGLKQWVARAIQSWL